MFNDVAIWPMILIGGLSILLIAVVVACLVILSVVLIKKAKKKETSDKVDLLSENPIDEKETSVETALEQNLTDEEKK